MPRLGPRLQQRVLRRQRSQAAYPRVDARRVGDQQLAVVRIERREVTRGSVREAKAPHQPVGLDAALADGLGESPGRDSPLDVDLEEAVLGVDEALPVDRARLGRRVDVGHAEAVTHDAHRLAQSPRRYAAIEARMRAPAADGSERSRGRGRLLRE